MNDIVVDKANLLETLKKNRTQHRNIFLEACDGYRAQAEKLLAENLEQIRQGKMMRVYVVLPLPEDHTKDYDRIIGMIEMDQAPTVRLTERDYQAYVMDDWAWKRQFLTANSMYGTTAKKMSEELGDG